MKVAHVGFSPDTGGASIAMSRIHEAVSLRGASSEMITLFNVNKNDSYRSLYQSKLLFLIHKLLLKAISVFARIVQRTGYKTTRSLNIFPTGFAAYLNNSRYDVIHLHWVGNEAISIAELSKINKPIVWTMHDLWAILGAEHNNISFSNRYSEGYNDSNRDSGYLGLDIEKFVWKRKFTHWKDKKINIVAVSSWQSGLIKQSPIFKKSIVEIINNPIDTQTWYNVDKKLSRATLKLKNEKKLLLFGAFGALIDPIKGYDKLLDSLRFIDNDNVEIAIFGNTQDLQIMNMKTYSYGVVKDHSILRMLYSAADVMIVPSLQETFGQTASEAMACNTPVVAFGGTGLDDIVEHKVNGYLAKPYLTEDLATGINWVLNNCENIDARSKISANFSYSLIGQKYLTLYKEILNG